MTADVKVALFGPAADFWRGALPHRIVVGNVTGGDDANVWAVDAELTEWVDEWLIPTFALDVILKNWSEEPALCSELQALKLGYQAMAASADAPSRTTSTAWPVPLRIADRPSARASLSSTSRMRKRSVLPARP